MFEVGVETVTVFLINRPRASLSGISFILAQQGRGFFHRALAILPAAIRRWTEWLTIERLTPSSWAISGVLLPSCFNCSTRESSWRATKTLFLAGKRGKIWDFSSWGKRCKIITQALTSICLTLSLVLTAICGAVFFQGSGLQDGGFQVPIVRFYPNLTKGRFVLYEAKIHWQIRVCRFGCRLWRNSSNHRRQFQQIFDFKANYYKIACFSQARNRKVDSLSWRCYTASGDFHWL